MSRLDPGSYARAGRLIGSNLTRLLLNAAVVPHWLGLEDRFWYERELRDGHEFVLVDAATCDREPAFDHEAVAAALRREHGGDVDATHLPFRELEFEPDGRTVTVSVGNTRLRVDPRGAIQRRSARARPPGLLVAPTGRHGLTTRLGNLWLTDLTRGTDRRLTHDGTPEAGYGIHPDAYGCTFVPRSVGGEAEPPLGVSWSPSGRWVVVPYVDQRGVEPYPLLDSVPNGGQNGANLRPRLYRPRIPLVGERHARVDWFSIDLETGAVRPLRVPTDRILSLQADLLPIESWWWHREQPHVYAAAFGDNMESAFLFDIDVSDGTVRTVIEESTPPRTDLNTTSYNPPNVWVDDEGHEAIWFSQRDGWGHLYRYDVQTGEMRGRVTEGEWVVRDLVKVDAGRGLVYFSAGGREPGNPYHRYLYAARTDGTELRLLTPEAADHHIQPARRLVYSPDGMGVHDAIAPSGRFVVYTYSTVERPPRSVLRSLETGAVIAELEVADTSALTDAGWRPPQEFVVKADDGVTDLWGVMYTPPELDPDGSYPLLDAQYAAPLVATTPRNFYQACEQAPALSQAAYAELGFVVITIDGRGTPLRSKAFMDATWGHLEANGLGDHVAAIRQLADRHAFIDLDRVGVYGVSYGGYMTIRAMLEFPDVFAAGIATAPIAVMPGMYSDYHWTAYQGRPRYGDGSQTRPRLSDVPENWRSIDAREQASELKGRLFLQIGELDENVLPAQLMLFVDALVAANKDFEMLYLPGRDHYLMREGYLWRRNWDFMVRHLLDVDPPEDPPLIEVAPGER